MRMSPCIGTKYKVIGEMKSYGWSGTKILRTASIVREEIKAESIPLGCSAHPMKSMEVRVNPDGDVDNNSI